MTPRTQTSTLVARYADRFHRALVDGSDTVTSLPAELLDRPHPAVSTAVAVAVWVDLRRLGRRADRGLIRFGLSPR